MVDSRTGRWDRFDRHALAPPPMAPAAAIPRPVPVAETDAFTRLYRDRFGPMVRLAHLITGSNAVAPDLVQDAFVKVSPRMQTLDNPAAYLRTVVVNECRMWMRRTALERRHARSEPPAMAYPPEVDETWAALARLPERQRAVVVLKYYEDMSVDEIARTLGIRPGTTKSHLHRGLAALRQGMAS